MNVVRHHAIGVNEKFACAGVLSKFGNDPARNSRVGSEPGPMVETQCDEVDSPAAIRFGAQADVLALERSGGRREIYV